MADEGALRAFNKRKNERTIKIVDRDVVCASVKERISGHDDAIELIVEQIRNGIAANPKLREGPIGVFMLLGPPGTGKTSLARALAEAIFGNDDGFYTIDMNSCRDEHAAWTYFGSPQGYTGGFGLLTSAIKGRRSSGTLILLDEFEKADATVHRMFLSAWATGFIVENRDGSQIDTRNTIWILTSNAATADVQRAKRNVQDRDDFNEEMHSVLKDSFPPEVLSRVSEFICLDPLSFDGDNTERMGVGFKLVRNMLVKLADEYDLLLEDSDITDEAVGGILHLLATTFQTGGIRALQRWLRRQLASSMVDLSLAHVTQIRIDETTSDNGFRLKVERSLGSR